MPLFLRISATDWLEEQKRKHLESWTIEDTVRLAPLLAKRGVDLLDVSSGGSHPDQHPHTGPGYQVAFALKVKDAVGSCMAVGTVGAITKGTQAEELVQKDIDLIIVGRSFQKTPGLIFQWADELGIHVQMPIQIRWAFTKRSEKRLSV